MLVLLFTVINCKSCDAHRRELTRLAQELGISLITYNIDDPRYLHMSLRNMKKYEITKTPTIILLNEKNEIMLSLGGISKTLDKLRKFVTNLQNSAE